MPEYYDSATRAYVPLSTALSRLHDDAYANEVTVPVHEALVDYLTETAEDGEFTRDHHLLTPVPSTYPATFGNGTLIDRANRAVIDQNEYPWCIHVTDGYAVGGPYMIDLTAVLEDEDVTLDMVRDMVQVLEGLTDYPLLDEETHSRMEAEESERDWEDYGAAEVLALTSDESLTDYPAALARLARFDGVACEPALYMEHDGSMSRFATVNNEGPSDLRALVADLIVPA